MQNFKQLGRTLDFVESVLNHPTRASNLAVAGDPVSVGKIVGVSKTSPAATTEIVPVATEGVYTLNVVATDNVGNSAVALGDALYFDPANGVVSKNSTKTPYGRALGAVNAGATTAIDVMLTGF